MEPANYPGIQIEMRRYEDGASRYLIVIGPGEYDINTQQLLMREWVSIQGAGREATLIKGSVSGGNLGQVSALVVGGGMWC